MNKFLLAGRKWLWIALYVTPVILGGYYFGGKLLRKVIVNELNQQLNVRMQVGSFELNSLKNFPLVGMRATKVIIYESRDHFYKPMLEAGEIVFVFNPLKLLQSKYDIERLEFNGGGARLYIGHNQKTNFKLFKTDSTNNNGDQNPFNLDLKKLYFSNFRVFYQNDPEQQSANVLLKDLEVSGKLGNDKYTLKTMGSAHIGHLSFASQTAIEKKWCSINLSLDVNKKAERILIKEAEVEVEDLMLTLEGSASWRRNKKKVDLSFAGKNVDIQSILSFLPNSYKNQLDGLKSNGQISVSGYVKGALDNKVLPELSVNIQCEDIALFWPKFEVDCRSFNAQASLSSNPTKNNGALILNIPSFALKTANSSLSGSLAIPNLRAPSLSGNLKGNAVFADFKQAFKQAGLTNPSGKGRFDLFFNLKWNETLEEYDFIQSVAKGSLDVNGLNISDKEGNPFLSDLSLKCGIAQNALNNVNLKSKVKSSDVHFVGSIKNWRTYLFNNQHLEVEGSLKGNHFNLNELLTSSSNQENTSPNSNPINLDYRVNLLLDLSLDYFEWANLKSTALAGSFNWKNGGMYFNNMRFNAWKGSNLLKAYLIPNSSGFVLSGILESAGTDIEVLFSDFSNFGQTEFTSNNLKGSLQTTVQLDMLFDRSFNPDEKSISCIAQIKIDDGQLNNYEPMQALSSFIALHDLKNVRFQSFENTLRIENRVVYIPFMSVKNNAMNLELSGTHSFDNYIDYRMKVRVTDLLATKSGWALRKREDQLTSEEDGGMSVRIHMYGTPDDLKIKYDKKSTLKNVTQEAKKEQKSFFEDLKKELKGEKTPTKDRKKTRWEDG